MIFVNGMDKSSLDRSSRSVIDLYKKKFEAEEISLSELRVLLEELTEDISKIQEELEKQRLILIDQTQQGVGRSSKLKQIENELRDLDQELQELRDDVEQQITCLDNCETEQTVNECTATSEKTDNPVTCSSCVGGETVIDEPEVFDECLYSCQSDCELTVKEDVIVTPECSVEGYSLDPCDYTQQTKTCEGCDTSQVCNITCYAGLSVTPEQVVTCSQCNDGCDACEATDQSEKQVCVNGLSALYCNNICQLNDGKLDDVIDELIDGQDFCSFTNETNQPEYATCESPYNSAGVYCNPGVNRNGESCNSNQKEPDKILYQPGCTNTAQDWAGDRVNVLVCTSTIQRALNGDTYENNVVDHCGEVLKNDCKSTLKNGTYYLCDSLGDLIIRCPNDYDSKDGPYYYCSGTADDLTVCGECQTTQTIETCTPCNASGDGCDGTNNVSCSVQYGECTSSCDSGCLDGCNSSGVSDPVANEQIELCGGSAGACGTDWASCNNKSACPPSYGAEVGCGTSEGCGSCQANCQDACLSSCEDACESSCQESCLSTCQESCLSGQSCGACQGACQTGQSCSEGGCTTTCQLTCQASCLNTETCTCQGGTCNSYCEGHCQSACLDGTCQSACQANAQCSMCVFGPCLSTTQCETAGL